MKQFSLNLKVAMTTALLALPVMVIGGNPIKVFDFGIDNVYNIYIDPPVSSDGEPTFCFQTSDKLIKTDPQGKIIAETANPYRYFTVLNGDTLILKGYAVINTKGDTVAHAYGINGSYQYLAVSSSGIYVFQNMKYGTSSVMDFLSNNRRFMASDFKGLCCGGGFIYGISKQSVETFPSLLYYQKENDLNNSYSIPQVIKEPRGIAEYQNYLYIYSASDKALYKIEAPLPPNQTVTESSADSLKIGSDTIYYYERNRNFSVLLSADLSIDNIDTVVLYSLTTDLFIQKKDNASKRDIESLVKRYLPDANFKWDSGEYDYRCSVTTNSTGLNEAINALLNEDAIVSVSKKYIRKDLMDLMDLYPFTDEVYTFTLMDKIYITYLDESTWEKADELIESMGLIPTIVEDSRTDVYKSAYLEVPRSMNVVSVANRLYESGYFLYAGPYIGGGGIKKCQSQTIDPTNIPFYYGASKVNPIEKDGIKQYLYAIPGSLTITKESGTEKKQMESLIKTSCGDYCKIEWLSDDYCYVKTNPGVVKNAIEMLVKDNNVKWVSEKYLDNANYVQCLKTADKMSFWGLDGKLVISFKDDVSDAAREGLINKYNLNFVAIDSLSTRGELYVKWIYQLPKTEDVVSVCNSIFESGYVQYAVPNIIKEKEGGIHFNTGSSTTNIKEKVSGIKELGAQYYDMLGRRMDSPSGLTIVVTRYSDGSVRTEKKLFR